MRLVGRRPACPSEKFSPPHCPGYTSTIVIHFRIFELVVSTDIEKLYHQVLVSPEPDQSLTPIIWCDHLCHHSDSLSPTAPVVLCSGCWRTLPTTKNRVSRWKCFVLRRDFYVDNFLTGYTGASSSTSTMVVLLNQTVLYAILQGD